MGGGAWYHRVKRWGQTNIREGEARDYDVQWWRGHWRRTAIGGVIVNAGGIVAYGPTDVPLHHRADSLGERDLCGEICAAARADGLAVIARLDSSRAGAEVCAVHPEWFCRTADGGFHRAGGRFIACVNGDYHRRHMAAVVAEVIARYHPDGFFDNSWSGLSRQGGVCHCAVCRDRFRAATGLELPASPAPAEPAHGPWVQWGYRCRQELWAFYNGLTRGLGGPECLWLGNNGGDLLGQNGAFRDWAALAALTPAFALDFQGRSREQPLWSNGEVGKRLYALRAERLPDRSAAERAGGGPAPGEEGVGPRPVGGEAGEGACGDARGDARGDVDVVVFESIAMYQNGPPHFRLTARPEAEVRLWAAEAVAGGIRPWWHHVGGVQEDLRQFECAEAFFGWHRRNEDALFDRRPEADVAVLWGQRLLDACGGADPPARCEDPQRGMAYALVGARLPYALLPVDRLSPGALAGRRVLVLPNFGALGDAAAGVIDAWVRAGGALLATGETSLYDEDGGRRADFSLAAAFGASAPAPQAPLVGAGEWAEHSYLRIRDREGPLRAWGQTALLPFGGELVATRPRPGADATVPLTLVPGFPVFPPEDAWTRGAPGDTPALYLRAHGRGRVAYLPADIDRLYWRHHLPDHGQLLAALVRWLLGAEPAVSLQGPGLVDVHPYTQARAGGRRWVVHLVNLTNPALWHPPAVELVPIGPQTLRIGGADHPATEARLLVAERPVPVRATPQAGGGWSLTLEVPSILDHEVVVV